MRLKLTLCNDLFEHFVKFVLTCVFEPR